MTIASPGAYSKLAPSVVTRFLPCSSMAITGFWTATISSPGCRARTTVRPRAGVGADPSGCRNRGQANGLAPKTVEPHFVVWDCTGRITWQHEFDIGTSLTSVAATGGDYVAIAIGDAVQFYRPASQCLDRPIPVGAPIRYVASLPDGCIAAFSEDHVWRIVPTTGQVEDVGDTPGRVNSMAVTAAGVIYLAVGTELVRWAI